MRAVRVGMKTQEQSNIESRTYVCRQTCRDREEFGPSDLAYIDTLFADGRACLKVTGYSDGESVNQSKWREVGTIDAARWETIEEARRTSGWRRV